MARRASTRKNRATSRKNKNEPMMGGKRKGGKKTKRALSPALKAWNKKVMEAFKAGRAKNPNYKLKDAMKDAKKQK